MFNFLKKEKEKFIIILGAGRCGTSYLLDELNKIPNVNVYGENYNTFIKIIQSIKSAKQTLEKAKESYKNSNVLEKYKNGPYINVEWYQSTPRLKKLITILEKSLFEYFEGSYILRGFKEIRFFMKENVQHLTYFEKEYDVYYIHLTRNIEEQVQSDFWKNFPNAKEMIATTNDNIESVLGKKEKYIKIDLSQIEKDISFVRTFLQI